jgi:signal peptidase I
LDSNAFDGFAAGDSGFDYEGFDGGDSSEPGGGRRRGRSEAYDWVQCLVAALVFCVLVFSFFFRIIGIIGPSMQPSLHHDDRVLITKLFYTPRQGDVVVVRKDTFQEEPIIKRVIATEGQTVDIDFELGLVYVDGVALDEPYAAEPIHNVIDFDGPVTVPDNSVFVLGDNRNNSLDSRKASIGCVDTRYIIGRVLVKVLPLSDFEVF